MLKLLVLSFLTLTTPKTLRTSSRNSPNFVSRQFAARIQGDLQTVKNLVEKYGFTIKSKVDLFGIDDLYKLQEISRARRHSPRLSHRMSHKTKAYTQQTRLFRKTKGLARNNAVKYFTYQEPLKRSKRGFLPEYSPLGHRIKRNAPNKLTYTDEFWDEMWYLKTRNSSSGNMRVQEAWQAGYTGDGVVVTILDDGLERDHPDLTKNFNWVASRDINDGDDDPMPRYTRVNENKHGTRCAGIVAAEANNHKCVAGIAYNATVGGVKMLDGEVNDIVEAEAIHHATNYVDIYSASWGPDDNGKTVDGPRALTRSAFKKGALQGRGGKGSIYVWASGNGGSAYDSCACDGYTNNIYTISVGAATADGGEPWYGERCSSILVTAFSSGDAADGRVYTTDLRWRCTEAHTGTSASAPMRSVSK